MRHKNQNHSNIYGGLGRLSGRGIRGNKYAVRRRYANVQRTYLPPLGSAANKGPRGWSPVESECCVGRTIHPLLLESVVCVCACACMFVVLKYKNCNSNSIKNAITAIHSFLNSSIAKKDLPALKKAKSHTALDRVVCHRSWKTTRVRIFDNEKRPKKVARNR